MRIEGIRYWQWIIIGLMLGAVVGGVRYYWADNMVIDSLPGNTIPSQDRFEKILLKRFDDGQRYMHQIEVYPLQDGNYIITCKVPREENVEKKEEKITLVPTKYKTTTPAYKPVWDLNRPPYYNLPQGGNYVTRDVKNVVDYLQLIADQEKEAYKGRPEFLAHPLRFKTALSAQPKYAMMIWGGGTFVVVGLIWPPILWLLAGAGFGRPPKDDYDLSRFGKGKPEKSAADAKPVVTQDDMDKLAALEKELERQLAAEAGPRVAASAGKTTEQPVRKLSAKPLEVSSIPAAEAEDQKKDFGATKEDFYPTEVHVKKKKD